MPRYKITRINKLTVPNKQLAAFSATNRSTATALFDEQKKLAQSGDTITVYDIKEALVLQTFSVDTPAEKRESYERAHTHYLERLNARVVSLAADIGKFSRDVEQALADANEDPSRNFEWVHNTTESACKLGVTRHALGLFAKGLTPDRVRKVARDQAFRGAKWPGFSTSPASNMVHLYRTAAWAELVEDLSWLIEMQTEAGIGCTCGEAYERRLPGTPKCEYCENGTPKEDS